MGLSQVACDSLRVLGHRASLTIAAPRGRGQLKEESLWDVSPIRVICTSAREPATR